MNNWKQARAGIRKFLLAFGINLKDPHFRDTDKRIVKMYCELLRGMNTDRQAIFKNAIFLANSCGAIYMGPIEYVSVCKHHFTIFKGNAFAGYEPDAHICGLSKIPRLVAECAAAPTLQEHLASEISQELNTAVSPRGVGIWLDGQHGCVSCRGIKSQSYTGTMSQLGSFKNPDMWRNFMHFIQQRSK